MTLATGTGTGDWSNAVSNAWDAQGRLLAQTATGTGGAHALTMAYDAAGRRTRLTWGTVGTWGGGFHVDYDYLLTNEMTSITENLGEPSAKLLASYTYDDLGRRRSLVRGNGVRTDWTPDGISRLAELKDSATSPRVGQTVGLSYNGVSQLIGRTASNGNYAYPNYAPATQNVTPN